MAAKYSRYLMGGGFEPTWAYVAERTEKETMLNYSLDMQVLPKLDRGSRDGSILEVRRFTQ